MKNRKVTVKGTSKNLFKVSEYDGKYYVYQVSPGFFGDTSSKIGETSTLEDALSLIRSYTGKDIDNIGNW